MGVLCSGGRERQMRRTNLVEIARPAARHLRRHVFSNARSILVPESWVRAVDGIVAEREIPIPPRRFPNRVVLGEAEWSGGIEIALEAQEVPHGGHGVFQDDEHAPSVDLGNR